MLASPTLAHSAKPPSWCEPLSVTSSGFERRALVHLPDGYEKSDEDYPVVFMFHGGDGSAAGAAGWWTRQRDRDVILVFPDGQRVVPEFTAWLSVTDDPLQHVAYVKDLLEDLDGRYRIDRDRVYAAGFSSGGYMTNKLLCYAPELFAGFAVVGQTLNLEDSKRCEAKGEPIIWMIGDADEKSFWHGKAGTHSVPETLDRYLAQGGCSSDRTQQTIDRPGDDTTVQHYTYGTCKHIPSLEFLHIENGGHSWPGRDKEKSGQCRDIDASEMILDYWKRTANL